MAELQDYYLQQIGITQWQLRSTPISAHTHYSFANNTKLILMAQCFDQQQTQLFAAIAKAVAAEIQSHINNLLELDVANKSIVCFGETPLIDNFKLIKTYSLQNMLDTPAFKKEVWQLLKNI